MIPSITLFNTKFSQYLHIIRGILIKQYLVAHFMWGIKNRSYTEIFLFLSLLTVLGFITDIEYYMCTTNGEILLYQRDNLGNGWVRCLWDRRLWTVLFITSWHQWQRIWFLSLNLILVEHLKNHTSHMHVIFRCPEMNFKLKKKIGRFANLFWK